jgi:transmembrane sensor
MKKPRIDFILLWKKLFGKLDNQEQATLDTWLDADAENRELLEKLDAFQQGPRKISGEQRDQAWQRLKTEISTTRTRSLDAHPSGGWKPWYRAAAAVLLIGVATALLWNYDNTPPASPGDITIAPGRARATLITSAGKSISLGDSAVNLNNSGIPAQASGTNLIYFTPQSSASVEEVNTLIIPRGGEFELTLADGTHVWLNSESTIRYPAQFTGELRWVELTGEAYFDVAKNKERPFKVISNGQAIAVYGTSFNVTAYPDESRTLTTLVEGNIAVNLNTGASLQVTPGYQSVFDATTGSLSTRKVDTDVYTSWKDGLFIFEDEKLSNILSRLERWYDVKIEYANARQKDSRFTAHVDKYQSATEVLKLMQVTGAVEFEVNTKAIIVK